MSSNKLEPETAALIAEALGFAQRGDHQQAWSLIESLPAGKRSHHQAVHIRLLSAADLKMWIDGEEAAAIFAGSEALEHRELAGKFYLEYIRWLARQPDTRPAWDVVRKLSICWPEGKAHIIDDPDFSRLFD